MKELEYIQSDLRGMFYIALKDMKTYYLKPPAVSWGIVFPFTWILGFYLRNPKSFTELVPGLIAMTILFSTTAAEAVVINFELRLGSFERLLLAPIRLPAVLLGKVLGGLLFGALMTSIVLLISVVALGLNINLLQMYAVILPSLLVFSSLGSLISVSVKEVMDAQTLLNIPRFLMIFVSGVVFPISKMPEPLQWLAAAMPLTYTVRGIQGPISGGGWAEVLQDAAVNSGFSAVFLVLAVRLLRRRFQ
jgi:ABC-2 type transport system permease protein